MHSGLAGTPPTPPGARLPWPPEWPRSDPRTALALVLLGVVAAGMAGAAAVALSAGDRGAAIFFAAAAALLILVVGGVGPLLRARRRWPARAVTAHTGELAERGVRIPYAGWWYGWLLTLIAALSVGLGAVALAVLVTGAGGLTAGSSLRLTALALLGTVAVPYFAWFLFDAARGRIARGHVALTPQGIRHRGLTHEEFVPWDAVHGVAAGNLRGPRILLFVAPGARQWRATSRVGFQRKPADPSVLDVHGRLLGMDPAGVYHALGYYLSRPQARTELATDAGVQRIRTGDLPAS